MQWLTLAAEEPLNPAQIGALIITGIALLPAAYYIILIYQKLYPKRPHAETYVTVAELHAAFNGLKEESANGIGSVRRKCEAMEADHRHFITRKELNETFDTRLQSIQIQLKEHGELLRSWMESSVNRDDMLQKQLHTMGTKFVNGMAAMGKELAVVADRVGGPRQKIIPETPQEGDDNGV